MAKSALARLPQRQAGFLPAGWRHEQMSVAVAWARNSDLDPLTLRLIGTSHGRGRGIFKSGALQLLHGSEEPAVVEAARELYDAGLWDAWVDATDIEWGFWGIAWLEAVLRAADVTISKEGR